MDITQELHRLNPRQREAVLHTEGPLLILAGAGSGKTRVLTIRTAYLIQKGIPANNVLAVTFTNKASREMKERVSSILKGVTGQTAVTRSKGPTVSTFHSLCLAILRREIERLGYRKDFTIYDTSDQLSLLRGILTEVRFADKSFKVEAVMERISKSKNDVSLTIHRHSSKKEKEDDIDNISEYLYPKYLEALKSFNALDFDDLILFTLRLFREHPDVLKKYQDRFRYIMVDEYQDTNRMQYDFIGLLASERKNLCVVGDDDQSIYAWRGASLSNILDFEHDFPGTTVVRLEQNYRSLGNILKAANNVIKNNERRMEKSLWTTQGDGPEVMLYKAPGGDEEAEWVASRIQQVKYEKKLSFEDFAVIYRANVFSRQFEQAMRKLHIPYSVVGGMSYFEYREVKDIIAYLRIIANPRDELSLLRIANTPKRGLGPTTLGSLSDFARQQDITLLEAFVRANEIDGLTGKPAEAAEGFAVIVGRYKSLFDRNKDMAAVLRELISEINYRDHIQGLFKTPNVVSQRLQNVEDFIGAIAHFEKTDDSPTLQAFLETLALTDLLKDKEERNGNGVTLISFHSSKGLEFPVVFIVGVEDDILPHKKSIYEASGLEEERRLFYVGITRAMKELYVCYAGHRIRYGKSTPCNASRFLDELPEDAIRRIDGEDESDVLDEQEAAKAFFSNIKNMLGD
ncbi:MAG TPA: UvrD-helicase domain-containing protein [Dissulfurispiraceae bacterium]|nr:UvrD-helicase domain-containing protein [Dissulfurispiraceae bacterium]